MVTTNAAAIMAATDEDVERWDAYEAVLLRRTQARLLGIKVVIPARAKAPKPEPVKLVFAPPATQPDGRASTWRVVVAAIIRSIARSVCKTISRALYTNDISCSRSKVFVPASA